MEQFIEKLAEIFEVDEISKTDVLADFDEWDSLTVLTIIAAIDTDFNLNISADELSSFKNVGELLKFIEDNKK